MSEVDVDVDDDALVAAIDPGDLLRGRTYMLLAALLAEPPTEQVLEMLRSGPEQAAAPEHQAKVTESTPTERGSETDSATSGNAPDPLTDAWEALTRAAREADPEACTAEYQELFIGIGRGELLPYGSWYQTGFLMETPLAELREDLERLGFERNQEVAEPEDHAAALCEVMAMLCGIEADTPPALDEQRAFYQAHLAPWLGRFFHDLQGASNSRFYRPVGMLGEAFMMLEARYLEMPV